MQLFRFLFTFCSLLYISPSHQKVKMYFVSFSQTFDNYKITNLCSWGKTREICLKAVDWVWVYLMHHLCPWFGLGTKKNKICAPLNTQPERLVVVLKDETSEISWNPHCHQMSSDSVLHNTQADSQWCHEQDQDYWEPEIYSGTAMVIIWKDKTLKHMAQTKENDKAHLRSLKAIERNFYA